MYVLWGQEYYLHAAKGSESAASSGTTSKAIGSESIETTSPEAVTAEAEKINYYVSGSKDFTNYSFVCPDKWELFEEENGSRVLIKNSINDTTESILILVESLSGSTNINLKNDADIEKKYLESDRRKSYSNQSRKN